MSAPQRVHMVGIGGIGLSALAQFFLHEGVQVSGSDREESPTTALIASKGAQVFIGHDACIIPADTELLIYSDAVSSENTERVRARDMGLPERSYFQALGDISKQRRTIAVAGTHGKTTTTAMLASILRAAGMEPTAIVGSIVSDWGSNFMLGGNVLVVEACEYKNHLLELMPEILVITNLEWDHTDFFPDLQGLQETFRKAVQRIPEHGCVITDPADPNIVPVLAGLSVRVVDYTKESVPKLLLVGEFNRDNARAAKSAARAAFPGIAESVIDQSLAAFRGSWRRFEYKGETAGGAQVYDDYAHHPTAVEKTLRAAREKFPGKRLIVAFHPHLYSRTRDLLDGFTAALSLADEALIAPIYAAREKDDGSVSSDILAGRIRARGGNAAALDVEGIRAALEERGDDSLIITMGAGDIYKVAEQIVT